MGFNHRCLLELDHRVVVEVGLLHHTVDDVDLAVECSGEGEDHRAFHLLRHDARVDHGAAVDGAHHPVHAWFAINQRDLGNLRDDGAEGLMQRHTPRPACRCRGGPLGLFSSQVQHRQVTWRILQQGTPQCERVLFGFKGDFVDEALRNEGILRVPDRAPIANRHMRACGHVGHVLVHKAVRQIEQSFGTRFVRRIKRAGHGRQDAFQKPGRHRITCRLDRQSAVQPRHIDGCFQVRHLHGAVEIMAGVFLARPNQLHRAPATVHRHPHGLRYVVHFKAPAKTAAQQHRMQRDFVQINAGHLGGNGAGHFGHLRAGPERHLTIFDLGRAVHRFHRGVRQKRRAVSGFYHAGGL